MEGHDSRDPGNGSGAKVKEGMVPREGNGDLRKFGEDMQNKAGNQEWIQVGSKRKVGAKVKARGKENKLGIKAQARAKGKSDALEVRVDVVNSMLDKKGPKGTNKEMEVDIPLNVGAQGVATDVAHDEESWPNKELKDQKIRFGAMVVKDRVGNPDRHKPIIASVIVGPEIVDASRIVGVCVDAEIGEAHMGIVDNIGNRRPKTRTQCGGVKAQRIAALLGFPNFTIIDAVGFKGGIWCLWSDKFREVEVVRSSNQYVHVRTTNHFRQLWEMTLVYGSPNIVQRRELWQDLKQISRSTNVPWCVGGDMSTTLSTDERYSWRSSRGPDRDLCRFVEEVALNDLGFIGPPFTWRRTGVATGWVQVEAAWGETIQVFGHTTARKRQLLRRLNGITRTDERFGLTRELEDLQKSLWQQLDEVLVQESLIWA
ncbi:hypothetical protein K1719_036292 [Acacia pycnantha]|nr:hypothetical protein K1719_036292 [Acacia pycnantha]